MLRSVIVAFALSLGLADFGLTQERADVIPTGPINDVEAFASTPGRGDISVLRIDRYYLVSANTSPDRQTPAEHQLQIRVFDDLPDGSQKAGIMSFVEAPLRRAFIHPTSGTLYVFLPRNEFDRIWTALADPANNYRHLQVRNYGDHVWADVMVGRQP